MGIFFSQQENSGPHLYTYHCLPLPHLYPLISNYHNNQNRIRRKYNGCCAGHNPFTKWDLPPSQDGFFLIDFESSWHKDKFENVADNIKP